MDFKDLDTVEVSCQLSATFCISWSKDNRITLLVGNGIHVFEIMPTPLNVLNSPTLQRSWIPTSTALPLRHAVVENKNNSFFWSLGRKELYEMLMDQTLACDIDHLSSFSCFIKQCDFSPLINDESYISCLTNNGALEIYKWDCRKWIKAVDVATLWVNYCCENTSRNNIRIDFDVFKTKMSQLKIVTMSWTDKPEVLFLTGHEDGGICIWNVGISNRCLTMSVRHYIRQNLKLSSLTLCLAQDPNLSLLFVGFSCGLVKCLSIRTRGDGQVVREIDLWKEKDLIKPSVIRVEYLHSDLVVVTVKRQIILIQHLKYNSEKNLILDKTEWHEFPALIVGVDEHSKGFVVTLQNYEFYLLQVTGSNYSVSDMKLEFRSKNKNCYHCHGLAISPNESLWMIASSPKVNYDATTMKDISQLHIFKTELKTFKDLTEESSNCLVDKIPETYPATKIGEFSDLLELKKNELLIDPSSFKENFTFTSDMSLLKLKLLLWEAKLKTFTQTAELQSTVVQLERAIALKHAQAVLSGSLQVNAESAAIKERSRKVMKEFLKERKESEATVIDDLCSICDAATYIKDVKTSSCTNGHQFPRCCISLLPCDVVPYAFCRICDAVALLEFVSEGNQHCTFCDGLLVPDTRLSNS